MLAYERINISDGINVNKSDESKECTLCHYWYFLDKSFSYWPYLCDRCYNMTQKCKCFFVLKKLYTEFVFCL